MHIPVIGNGDIDCAEKAYLMREKYGVDAVMIGRSSIGNPWIFKEIEAYRMAVPEMAAPSINERKEVCLRHLHQAVEKKGEHRAVVEMRRHYAGYFKGIAGFKKVRMLLLTMKTESEIVDLLSELPGNIGDLVSE